MADSYVCSGATMRCSMGTSLAKLTVLPSRTVFLTGQPMANISDHLPMMNLAPFGKCRSLGFPTTAAATAAHHGHLTPMPCMHNTPLPWRGGKNDYIVEGDPALLKSSTCQCMWGGTISIVDDGQNNTGPADLSHAAVEDFEQQQLEKLFEGMDLDDVLDAIQMGLDIAGLFPGLGAIPDLINAAISLTRGDWGGAAASLAAAVPGIGDAAGAGKLLARGAKLKKAGTMVKTEKLGKAMDDSADTSRELLRKRRAEMLGTEYDPKKSQILYNTTQPEKKARTAVGKDAKFPEYTTDKRPTPNGETLEITIDPNAKNPFSIQVPESQVPVKRNPPEPKSTPKADQNPPKDYSADPRTYPDPNPPSKDTLDYNA